MPADGFACGFTRLRNPLKQVAYIWWILTFLLSTLVSVLSLIDLINGATPLSLGFYLAIASWPVACLLLACAIRGERWIQVTDPEINDGLTERLLDGSTSGADSPAKDTESPYATAGILSRMVFKWLDPVLSLGHKRPLQLKDVPHLNKSLQAQTAVEKFLQAWEAQRENNPDKPQSVFWALTTVYWRSMAINGICALGKSLALAFGPLILQFFIKYESGVKYFKYEGYTLVAALFFSKVLESFFQRHWYAGARMVGMQLRSGLIAAIYQKQLKYVRNSLFIFPSTYILKLLQHLVTEHYSIRNLFLHIRVILLLNMTFGWDLVLLHTIPSLFGKFSVHAWR